MKEKLEFLIPDMMCNNCVMHLENLENEQLGITWAQANLKKQTLSVEFESNQITEVDIEKAIIAKGYTIQK